jgi:cytochrome P450
MYFPNHFGPNLRVNHVLPRQPGLDSPTSATNCRYQNNTHDDSLHSQEGVIMSDNRETDWDPRDSGVLSDQRLAYDDMRERCPVAHSDFLGWSVFRHEDIINILADPGTYSNASKRKSIPNGLDQPEHTLYRNALEPFFGVEAMSVFETNCRNVAVNAVQALRSHGDEVEFVSAFARPFTVKSLCAYLGWPTDQWEQLAAWIHGNQQAALAHDRQAGKELALAFIGYVNDALNIRREAGAETYDDITAKLMTMEVAGQTLSDEDIASVLRNWIAGHGTVAASIGILTLYLAQHQQVQQHLRDELELLPTAIDEILRVDGPLVSNNRTTTRAVVIGGRTISAGERLSLIWIAANRDERAFDDARSVNFHAERAQDGQNLVFGSGIHDCVGAPLARLEMRIAMEELLRNTENIELGGVHPIRSGYPSNGLEALTVRLD